MTGFSQHIRDIVLARADHHCERCGHYTNTPQLHHRRPRGMGGSKASDTNGAANALVVCPDCHRWIESWRVEARSQGWLVGQHRRPADCVVWRRGQWVQLDDQGGWTVRAGTTEER